MSEFEPLSFATQREQILAVLINSQHKSSTWLTAPSISATLREEHGIGIHWRKVESILKANRSLVDRRKRDRKWQFLALQAAVSLLKADDQRVVFVEPSKALQSTLSLHAFLQTLRGVVRLCDPYVDPNTLDHLSSCSAGTTIRLLTKNLKEGGRLRVLLAAARTEGRSVEIRVAASAPLHDRYVIDDTRMLILGTSLNGFAKKQGFVILAGEDVRAVVSQAFDTTWATASPWT